MSANHSACWNWFQRADQLRDAGEPSIIAGLTRALMGEHDIDARRVYVAGLSAGGAMAAVMSATYPELYAAAGIHSGLAYGSATDLASAFAAMKGTPRASATEDRSPRTRKAAFAPLFFMVRRIKPCIPRTPKGLLPTLAWRFLALQRRRNRAAARGGRAYTRTLITDARGAPHVEYWAIEGLGHAWSGGRPDGSYTDPQGPDASREMLRFFLAGPAGNPAH